MTEYTEYLSIFTQSYNNVMGINTKLKLVFPLPMKELVSKLRYIVMYY